MRLRQLLGYLNSPLRILQSGRCKNCRHPATEHDLGGGADGGDYCYAERRDEDGTVYPCECRELA